MWTIEEKISDNSNPIQLYQNEQHQTQIDKISYYSETKMKMTII